MDNNQPDELNNYWKQQVDAWKSSGMSQAAFCQKHELIYHRFIYWKLKFTTCLPASEPPGQSAFVKVHVSRNNVPPDSRLSLTLTNGLVLKGLAESNLALVRQLVEQLS